MGTLLWICHGAFHFRACMIERIAKRMAADSSTEKDGQYHPHPHPNYPFLDIPVGITNDPTNLGLKLRTVMVENVLPHLRSEEALRKYFQDYMSRPIGKPGIGLTPGMQSGFFNKSLSVLFNRAKRIRKHLPAVGDVDHDVTIHPKNEEGRFEAETMPVIERVVIVRKMTELVSLLQRREDVLRHLETAHIKLARKTLLAVKDAVEMRHMIQPARSGAMSQVSLTTTDPSPGTQAHALTPDTEPGGHDQSGTAGSGAQMDMLIRTLAPYVDNFGLHEETLVVHMKRVIAAASRRTLRRIHLRRWHDSESDDDELAPRSNHVARAIQEYPFPSKRQPRKTVWEALLDLPRSSLDPYQPLISLSKLFRGKTGWCPSSFSM